MVSIILEGAVLSHSENKEGFQSKKLTDDLNDNGIYPDVKLFARKRMETLDKDNEPHKDKIPNTDDTICSSDYMSSSPVLIISHPLYIPLDSLIAFS